MRVGVRSCAYACAETGKVDGEAERAGERELGTQGEERGLRAKDADQRTYSRAYQSGRGRT